MTIRLHHLQLSAPLGQAVTARQCYTGVLGLREQPRPRGVRGGGVWFEARSGQLPSAAHKVGVQPIRPTHSALPVVDAALHSHRIKLADALPITGWTRLYAWDPSGNTFELVHIQEGVS